MSIPSWRPSDGFNLMERCVELLYIIRSIVITRTHQQLDLESEENDDLIASEFTFGRADAENLVEVARLQAE